MMDLLAMQKNYRTQFNVGVDIVKFQTHLSEFETSKDAPNPPYFSGENRFEYFERTAFDKKQYVNFSTLNLKWNRFFVFSFFN